MLEDIQLTSGRKVYVTSFECSGTYDGLLEGRPTVKINKSIVDNSLVKARHLWSKKVASPVHLIEPVCAPNPDEQSKTYVEWAKRILSFGDAPAPNLPSVTCIAELISLPKSTQDSYTKLVVVWFGSSFFEQPLKNVLQKSLENIQWEANAKSFDF